jgi:hypothetical protein
MVTKDNLKEVLESLSIADVARAVEEMRNDRVAVYCDIYEAYIISMDECEDEEDILSTGGFICDKDDFYRLGKEVGIDFEKRISEYYENNFPAPTLEQDYSDSMPDPWIF